MLRCPGYVVASTHGLYRVVEGSPEGRLYPLANWQLEHAPAATPPWVDVLVGGAKKEKRTKIIRP